MDKDTALMFDKMYIALKEQLKINETLNNKILLLNNAIEANTASIAILNDVVGKIIKEKNDEE